MICTPYNVIDLTTLLSCIVLILSPNMSQYVSKCLKMSQNHLKISQNGILRHFETFWAFLSNFEPFWAILSNFEQFWADFLGRYKYFLSSFEQFWADFLGRYKYFLSTFEQFWAILSRFCGQVFWAILSRFCGQVFWAILSRFLWAGISTFKQFWAILKHFEHFLAFFFGQI